MLLKKMWGDDAIKSEFMFKLVDTIVELTF